MDLNNRVYWLVIVYIGKYQAETRRFVKYKTYN